MPTNIVHIEARCPACSQRGSMAWEVRFGALAGEELTLGEPVPFDEAYSFYRRVAGDPHGRHRVPAVTLCPGCDAELDAELIAVDGVLERLEHDTIRVRRGPADDGDSRAP